MLIDLSEESASVESYDPIHLISNSPVRDLMIESETINVIMPFSLHGEVYHDIGDHFTYCLKTASPKRYKDLRYPANSC